jgi:hypothetical protein
MRNALIAIVASLALGGCATDLAEYDGYGFNAYYDGFYGPYYDGYWGRDRVFWYRAAPHGPWRRDEGRHFQHTPRQGFNGVHASRSPIHRH